MTNSQYSGINLYPSVNSIPANSIPAAGPGVTVISGGSLGYGSLPAGNTYPAGTIQSYPSSGYFYSPNTNWSAYGGYMRTSDENLLNNDLFVKCCNKKWVDKLIADKNYTCMINVSDLMLRNNRKLFERMERAILKSNDYTIIASYFDVARNFSVRHLTKIFLNSVKDSEMERLPMVARRLISKLDLGVCLSFAKKKKDIRFISWIFADANESINKYILNNDISENNIKYIIANCSNEHYLLNATMICDTVSQHLVYLRLKTIKSLDLAKKILEFSKEPWAEKLRNFR